MGPSVNFDFPNLMNGTLLWFVRKLINQRAKTSKGLGVFIGHRCGTFFRVDCCAKFDTLGTREGGQGEN